MTKTRPADLGEILIVDDEPSVVEVVALYLRREGFRVRTARDGAEALLALGGSRPALVILDVMLPHIDGLSILRRLRQSPALDVPVILLTARGGEADRIAGLDLGADDYVTKPYNPREVVARVRARLRQPDVAPPQTLRVGGLEMDVRRRDVRVDGRPIELTPTEFSLLQVLMEQAGYVLTRGELTRRALGVDFEGVERTLDSHIRNLRQKIEPDPANPTYVQTVYGVGFRLAEEAE